MSSMTLTFDLTVPECHAFRSFRSHRLLIIIWWRNIHVHQLDGVVIYDRVRVAERHIPQRFGGPWIIDGE